MLKNRSSQMKRPPRLGKIKIGEKTDKGHPTSVDYFIIDSEYKDQVITKYGEKPKVLNIVFPYNDIEQNLNEMYRWYGSSGLKCTGDGETFTQFVDNVEPPDKCPCDREKETDQVKAQCHASMILSFIITGVGVTGIWTFTSKSVYSRSNIRTIMEMVQNTTGKLAGVPFFLRVEMQESTISGKPYKFPVVNIDCAMDLEALMQQNLAISPGTDDLKQLKEPETEQKPPKTEQKPVKTEQNPLGLSTAALKEWDKFDAYLEDNRMIVSVELYNMSRKWLDGRTSKTSNLHIASNLNKLKEKVKAELEPKYQQFHESLIRSCLGTMKLDDAPDNVTKVVDILNKLIDQWDVNEIKKLEHTTENQCIHLLEDFDKYQKKDKETLDDVLEKEHPAANTGDTEDDLPF